MSIGVAIGESRVVEWDGTAILVLYMAVDAGSSKAGSDVEAWAAIAMQVNQRTGAQIATDAHAAAHATGRATS